MLSFCVTLCDSILLIFPFNAPSTTEIYTLSLHDALPISTLEPPAGRMGGDAGCCSGARRPSHTIARTAAAVLAIVWLDRKSTRLNSSHQIISYAVFCLKKKRQQPRKYGRITGGHGNRIDA